MRDSGEGGSQVSPSYFPLRDGAWWVFAVIDPMATQIVTVRARPPREIEVEDLLTREVRQERAWVLEQDGRDRPTFVVEREHGVEIVERCSVDEAGRRALAVTLDLRWAGDEAWSRPYRHYALQTRHFRRVGEEEVLVSAGRFRCLKIFLDEGEGGAVWLARGVGIVRSAAEVVGLFPTHYFTQELSGYSDQRSAHPAG